MGEIIFSIFIGCCLVSMGLLLNIKLYREEKKLSADKKYEEGEIL